jgi:hypothetical protein
MRRLKKEELDLITEMLENKSVAAQIIDRLPGRFVDEMDDGGMGSLRFVSDSEKSRKFGKEVASISLFDVDGIPLSFSINLDEDGDIFELDVFKADFSRLKTFPVPPYSSLPPRTF